MRLIFCCLQSNLLAQKLSGAVRWGQNSCSKKSWFFSKKVCLSTLCGPHNSQTYPLVMHQLDSYIQNIQNIQNTQNYKWCYKNHHKTLIISFLKSTLFFEHIPFVFVANIYFWNLFLYFGCVLYYKLLVLMRLSDSLSFSVYMKIFSFFLNFLISQKCEHFSYERFFEFLGNFGCPKWSPHPQRQCQSSLLGGKI